MFQIETLPTSHRFYEMEFSIPCVGIHIIYSVGYLRVGSQQYGGEHTLLKESTRLL